ncbi:MAG: MgtC/SapB family protein [Phycisphaerales bacterium]|nr:MAG: MgtC/SapB family protein [Phycisphaerales bacterium]
MPGRFGLHNTLQKDTAGTADVSVTRIAAQTVTGVGFLGAGAIIQDRGGVHGLTTAATIWLVASIGRTWGPYEISSRGTMV